MRIMDSVPEFNCPRVHFIQYCAALLKESVIMQWYVMKLLLFFFRRRFHVHKVAAVYAFP
jgi:hypothetical protein